MGFVWVSLYSEAQQTSEGSETRLNVEACLSMLAWIASMFPKHAIWVSSARAPLFEGASYMHYRLELVRTS